MQRKYNYKLHFRVNFLKFSDSKTAHIFSSFCLECRKHALNEHALSEFFFFILLSFTFFFHSFALNIFIIVQKLAYYFHLSLLSNKIIILEYTLCYSAGFHILLETLLLESNIFHFSFFRVNSSSSNYFITIEMHLQYFQCEYFTFVFLVCLVC